MADEPKAQNPEHTVAWCGGLPLRVSSPVADILAAVWLGFQISKQTLAPWPGAGEQVVSPGGGGHYGADSSGTGEPEYVTHEFFSMLNGMTPVAREAYLSSLGLSVKGHPEPEYDPTADTLQDMMAGDSRIPKADEDEI